MSNNVPRDRTYDVLAVGELVADFISSDAVDNVGDADTFSRYLGGSPANLARNLAVLGKRSSLVATVGHDGLGRYLVEQLDDAGVDTGHLAFHDEKPTSTVLIARSPETPDFIHYREADTQIADEQLPDALIESASVFHTTCVALSSDPARSAILRASSCAADAGCHLSIDANYVRSHWPNPEVARRTIREYCRETALVKVSMDDVERLFESDSLAPEDAVGRVHDWGARLACLTMGDEGSLISWKDGERRQFVEAESVDEVHGATGAGDAYWSGFLTGWLDDREPPRCAAIGAKVAAAKVRRPGPLSGPPPELEPG